MSEKTVFHIDIDRRIDKWGWLPKYEEMIKAVLEKFNFQLQEIIVKPSPSKKGLHIWIHALGKPLSDEELNMFHFLLGDDRSRVYINQLRIERGIKKYWSKLFTRHIWTKPLPKICQKCKLRKTIMEMEKVGLETDNSHDSA